MRGRKQETREEKLHRQIRNLTAVLEMEPTLRCVRKKRTELEAKLREMPEEKRLALVPKEETERELNQSIEACDEWIADLQKQITEKKQGVQEVKAELAEVRGSRAKLLRQARTLG
jgi:hypothetical protein